jgi:hypothetical protein
MVAPHVKSMLALQKPFSGRPQLDEFQGISNLRIVQDSTFNHKEGKYTKKKIRS